MNRNIMCTPAPIVNRPEYVYARQYTKVTIYFVFYDVVRCHLPRLPTPFS